MPNQDSIKYSANTHELSILSSIASGSSGTHSDIFAQPTEFGQYTLLRSIGKGGYGEVFLAIDQYSWNPIAIKMLKKVRRDDDQAVQRFEQEILIGKQLTHPNILPIIDDGECQGIRFFVTPYISGLDLLHRLAKKPMHVHEAVEILRDVTSALCVAHENGFYHRDIKPENILIEEITGKAYIADFGLAKSTRELSVVSGALDVLGTQSYMPPEQIDPNLGEVSAATDVYALGATLYQMITGRPPFPLNDHSGREITAQIAWDHPNPPSKLNPQVPRDLDQLCLICLEKSPFDRYSSAHALEEDLRRFASGHPIEGRLPSRLKRVYRRCQRQPAVVAVIITLLVLMTVVGFAAKYFAGEATQFSQELADVAPKIEKAETRAVVAERNQTTQDYLLKMQEIGREWEEGNMVRVGVLLDETAPSGEEKDLRGFEWYFWKQRLKSVCFRFPSDLSPRGLALSDDGNTMLVVSNSNATAWSVESGERLFTKTVGPGDRFGYLYEAQDGKFQRASVNTDGSLLAITYPGKHGGGVRVWNSQGVALLKIDKDARLSGHAISFSPDGKHLVVAGLGGNWVSWETRLFKESSPDTYSLIGRDRVNPHLHPTTTLWFDGVDELHTFGGGLRIWGWGVEHTKSVHRRIINREISVIAVDLNMHAISLPPIVVAGVIEKQLRTNRVDLAENFDELTTFRYSKFMVAGCSDRIVREWEVPIHTNGSRADPKEYRGSPSIITIVAKSKTRVAAACEDGTVCVWPGGTSPIPRHPPQYYENSESTTMPPKNSSPSGQYSLATEQHGAVGRLLDREGNLIVEFSARRNGRLGGASWSPDERYVAIMCSNQGVYADLTYIDTRFRSRVILLDCVEGRLIKEIACPDGRIHGGIAFSPDSDLLGVSVWGRPFTRLLQSSTGTSVREFDVGGGIRFNSAGTRIAISNSAVSIFDVGSGVLEHRYEGSTFFIRFIPLGDLIQVFPVKDPDHMIFIQMSTGEEIRRPRDFAIGGNQVVSQKGDRLYVSGRNFISIFDMNQLTEGPILSTKWPGAAENPEELQQQLDATMASWVESD